LALKATIFKAELTVSDLDRGHFETHALTLARHPSETDERMMVRLLAFALNADERLAFGRGLSSEGEADLVLTDLTGAIDLWIDVGLPDERHTEASGRASCRGLHLWTGAELWWKQNGRRWAASATRPWWRFPWRTRAGRRPQDEAACDQDGHVGLPTRGSIAIDRGQQNGR
jgi:uncharacterized protein YaeQ